VKNGINRTDHGDIITRRGLRMNSWGYQLIVGTAVICILLPGIGESFETGEKTVPPRESTESAEKAESDSPSPAESDGVGKKTPPGAIPGVENDRNGSKAGGSQRTQKPRPDRSEFRFVTSAGVKVLVVSPDGTPLPQEQVLEALRETLSFLESSVELDGYPSAPARDLSMKAPPSRVAPLPPERRKARRSVIDLDLDPPIVEAPEEEEE